LRPTLERVPRSSSRRPSCLVFSLAAAYNKPVVPHFLDVGITRFAGLHVYATVPGGTWLHEYSPELYHWGVPPVQDLFEHRVVPVGGKITLPDRPRLGLTLNEQVLHRTLLAEGSPLFNPCDGQCGDHVRPPLNPHQSAPSAG
ncbi:MAG: enolase C-terminal domain-like protein, partial [Phycisphaeraceae bacterium]|nr:enolase C-terminal domain-like protein [Phycisphaeraceae bacterium]